MEAAGEEAHSADAAEALWGQPWGGSIGRSGGLFGGSSTRSGSTGTGSSFRPVFSPIIPMGAEEVSGLGGLPAAEDADASLYLF